MVVIPEGTYLMGSSENETDRTTIGELRRSLACTNIVENALGTVRQVSRNPWFEAEVIPAARVRVRELLAQGRG